MRILGIDLGSTGVKAVEIESGFGRFEIREYYEGATLSEILTRLPKPADRISVAMRTGQVTFRNLQLPTRDKKAIQSSVIFELDDDLPFGIDSAAYDYSILSQQGSATSLHIAATLRRNLENSIETWKTNGADPDLITSEGWSYRSLFNRLLPASQQEAPVLLAHLGHARTVIYAHWRGQPVVARELDWGGRDLNEAICKRYGIPLEEAERTKHDNGFVLPRSQVEQATDEQREFSQTLQEAMEPLIRSLRQAELTVKNTTHQNLSTIFISGGTSLLPGLGRALEEEIQIPVQPLQALSRIAGSGVTYSEPTEARFGLALANALCLVGSEKASGINFRKGMFSKQGRSTDLSFAALKKPILGASVVLGSFFLTLIVENSVYKSRIKDADSQLEKQVKNFFGQISNSGLKNYLARPTELKNSINKELTKNRELARLLGPHPRSPLTYLKELSGAVARDTIVDMTQYQVGSAPTSSFSPSDEGTVSLTFLVSSPQMVEKLASSLGARISNIQRSKVEEVDAPPAPMAAASPGPDGAPPLPPPSPEKKWKITFSGKPTEEAYGK